MSSSSPTTTLVRGLGLTAAIAIVIGDVIGTGVYLKARVMTCNVGTPELVIAAWVVPDCCRWPAPSPMPSSAR